jgi:carboxylesterase
MPRDTAVLVIHGFPANPRTVGHIAGFLERGGFAYEIPTLRGHGTRYQDLNGVRSKDWIEDAMAAYERLERAHGRVTVVGHSMGGLVAANVVAHYPQTPALVMVAPAFQFSNPAVKLLPILGKVVKYWSGGPSAVIDPKLRAESETQDIVYKRFPVKAFEELFNLSKTTPLELEKIRCPALVIHSRKDQVIPNSSAELAVKHLGSKDKRLKWFEQSGHEMFWDMERDALCETIVKFLLEHSQEVTVPAIAQG